MMADQGWEVRVDEVKAMLDRGDDVLLLDVRQPEEHAIVNIAEAKLVPLNDLPSRLGELQAHADKPVVVYCHHGGRSLQATAFLRQQGFETARSMAGGIDEWAERIEPGKARY